MVRRVFEETSAVDNSRSGFLGWDPARVFQAFNHFKAYELVPVIRQN